MAPILAPIFHESGNIFESVNLKTMYSHVGMFLRKTLAYKLVIIYRTLYKLYITAKYKILCQTHCFVVKKETYVCVCEQ